MPGAVAGAGERVGESPLVGAQQGAAADGVPDAGAVAEMAGEEAGAGGGAGGADVVVGEAHGVPVKAVEAGVRIASLPWQPRSPYPWSSVRTKTMLGREVMDIYRSFS